MASFEVKSGEFDFNIMRPWLITIAVSFFLATVVSMVVLKILMPSPDQLSMKKSPTSAGLSETESSMNWAGSNQAILDTALKKILERNIFNSSGENGVDQGMRNANEMSATTLPVKLLGVIFGGSSESSVAIVSNTAKSSVSSFLQGDRLEADAVVVEIKEDRIIIDYMGRREFLEITQTDIVRSQRRKGKKTRADRDTGGKDIASLDSFREEGFERKGGQIEMSADYKNRLINQDLAQVLQDAKATPNVVGGELKGFRLEKIKNGSIYEKAGLMNGDIVDEINGIPLQNVAQAIQLLQSLRNESEVDMKYTRDGKKNSLNMKVR